MLVAAFVWAWPLTDIGRQNELQVTDDEKNRAIFAEAQRYPGQEQQVLEYFQKNPEAAQQLAGPIFEDKVVDYILEIAKVNDNVISVKISTRLMKKTLSLRLRKQRRKLRKKLLLSLLTRKHLQKRLLKRHQRRKRTNSLHYFGGITG